MTAAEERATNAERERDHLPQSYDRLREELELLRRRIVVATAERVDTKQLELEFAQKLQELEKAAGTLGLGKTEADAPKRPRPPPTERRDLRELKLREERVELRDPYFERLVAEGKATLHGFEENRRIARKRAEMICLVTARAEYRTFDEERGETAVVATPKPPELLDRSIATPSLAAHLVYGKVHQKLTLFRLEEQYASEGAPLDRGSMSRMVEHLGATLGATVVEAMRGDSKQNAFCIATDATGFKIQPPKSGDKKRKPCLRGHIRTMIADRDHVIFDYVDSENSVAIQELFAGYQGYVQADAASVYDALFASDRASDPPCLEVACWSHLRRYFWEATVGEKSDLAKEALYRVHRIFDLDAGWQNRSARARQVERDKHLRPHVEAFFEWCRTTREQAPPRSLLAKAFGYSLNHETAFRRFLDDGRLKLENNRSERALRQVAIGRKNWLFAGSAKHAEALAHLLSLDASAKLHGLPAETYFRDLIRVLPFWPEDRYLELCPREWAKTRARLDDAELTAEVGAITVPPATTAD
ncbi:MAG: IS66 family transposase [Sandaracinus sp.]|nr:IS66 family transposase [Sandaracinus sp.]